jgi:pimeloyl-ACP methyl ester carboxylesterase
LTDGLDCRNTTRGNDKSVVLAPDFSFDIDTAPMLLLHGDADVYSAMGSVQVWEKAQQIGVQSELHIYATRGHCFQKTASPGTGSYTFMDRIWEFLTVKGFNR